MDRSRDEVGARRPSSAAAAVKSPLCRPCYLEIEVRAPPASSRLMTTLPSPMPPAAAAAAVASVANVSEAGGGAVAGTTVVAPAAAVQLLPPRQPSSSVHPQQQLSSHSGHVLRIVPADGGVSSSGLGIADGGHLLVGGRARNRSSSVAPEQPQSSSSSSSAVSSAVVSSSSLRAGHRLTSANDSENQNPNTTGGTSSNRDRDHNPALIAAKIGVNRSSASDNHPAAKKNKPLTPQVRHTIVSQKLL